MSGTPTYLITRADDLGSSHSANMAIMDAYKKGILRNTSVIVPGHQFEEAAEMFAGQKDMCVGLHSAITCEWHHVRWSPVLGADNVPSLVDNQGALHTSAMAIHENGTSFAQILAEIQAQLDKARAHGLDIKYVDSHMGYAWLFEESEDNRFYEPLRRWAEREGLLCALGLGTRLPMIDKPTGDRLADLKSRLQTAQPGRTYVLVGHPAFNDTEMFEARYDNRQPGEIAAMRDIERRFFVEPSIVETVSRQGIVPVSYVEAARRVREGELQTA